MGKIPLVMLVLSASAIAQTEGDPSLARIRTEGLEHSQVAPVFAMFTENIGPRLTASPAHKRAAEYARERLASYGLTNAHLEPWTFGRGWTLEKLTVEMVAPRYLPLLGYADGWSASTSGEIVPAPVSIGASSAPAHPGVVAPEAWPANDNGKEGTNAATEDDDRLCPRLTTFVPCSRQRSGPEST